MDSRNQMWINGEFTSGVSGRTIDVHDPATEEVLDRVPAGNANDAARAVDAASAAFADWRRMPAGERGELLHEVARKIPSAQRSWRPADARGRQAADREPRRDGLVGGLLRLLRRDRPQLAWTRDPLGGASQLNLVLKEPYGVVATIVPWNYPILLMAWKVAPALAAGNTVVIKPSEMTPLSTLAFADIFEHLPRRGGQHRHRLRARGGRGAGARSARAGGGLHRQPGHGPPDRAGDGRADQEVHLELGGKDAFIVAEDADLDVAVPGVAWAALLNAGQVCTSAERVYVHEQHRATVHRAHRGVCAEAAVGPGMEPGRTSGR